MIEPYKPLFIHLNPASIPEVVAHIQKYLTENEFVTVDDFGTQFQEYIDAHPDIIKVGSVNGLTGNVVLTSENITMTGESSDTIGAVIGDILEDASSTGETVDDLAVDMDTAKTNIADLQSDVSTLQSDVTTLEAVFTGATDEASGAKGLVPAPANTQISHYLKATGDFEAIPARDVISAAVPGASTVEQALTVINSGVTTDDVGSIPLTDYTVNSHNILYEKIFTDGGTYLVVGNVFGNLGENARMDLWVRVDERLSFETAYENFNDIFSGSFAVLVTNSFRIFASSGVVPSRVVLRYQYIRLK